MHCVNLAFSLLECALVTGVQTLHDALHVHKVLFIAQSRALMKSCQKEIVGERHSLVLEAFLIWNGQTKMRLKSSPKEETRQIEPLLAFSLWRLLKSGGEALLQQFVVFSQRSDVLRGL